MHFPNRYLIVAAMGAAMMIICQCGFEPEWGDPYEEDQWDLLDKNSGLSSNQIMSLKADSEGNIWVGSWDNGLMRYDGEGWTYFTERDGLPDFTIFAIEEDSNGDILLGTFLGLSVFNGSRFTNYLFGQEYFPINDIHLAENQSVWMATAGFGLVEISDQFKQYFLNSKPESFMVNSITEDIHNVIWAGTAGGVLKISGSRVDYLTESDGLTGENVTAIAADTWGDVWLGIWAAENVLRYDQNSFEEVNLYNAYPDVGVNYIFEDSRENIWFALERAGVVKYDGSTMRTYRDVDGLPSNSINCIEEDLEGNIWFGSDEHGLARFKPGNHR